MTVKLVTYDLNNETARPNIVGDIKAYGSWARLSESCYAVDTTQSVSAIYNQLKKHIDGDDQLYVITLTSPYTGFGPKDVNDWLENRLALAHQ